MRERKEGREKLKQIIVSDMNPSLAWHNGYVPLGSILSGSIFFAIIYFSFQYSKGNPTPSYATPQQPVITAHLKSAAADLGILYLFIQGVQSVARHLRIYIHKIKGR